MNNNITSIAVEIEINAKRDHVWTCLTNKVSDWWPKDFMGTSDTSVMHFESFAGGRLYEIGPNGAQLLWGNVLMLVPSDTLEMVGHVSPAFGGPSVNFIRLPLTENGDRTTFRLLNTVLGNMSEGGTENVTQGWNYLYGTFKAFCEA